MSRSKASPLAPDKSRRDLKKPIHTIFQVSTSGALVAGVYDREVSPDAPRTGDFGLVSLHSDYDFFDLGLAEGSGFGVRAAHFGAGFSGCEHPFDAGS